MSTPPVQPSGVARSPEAATVAGAGIFSMVEPAAVAELTKQIHPEQFSARDCIYREGGPGDRLYVITSGKIKIGRRSADGRNHLLAVIGPSDTLGELSVLDDSPRTSSASALTQVDAVAVDRDVIRSWIVERPEIAERLLRVLARRLRRADNDLTA